MARFEAELPKEVLDDFEKIYGNTEKIFGAMTEAGAKTAMENAKGSVPIAEMANHIKVSRVYRTPSDGGINTKVYISGYFSFKGNRKTFSRRGRSASDVYTTSKGVPVDFVANIFEYGRSGNPFPKKPFFRKAFKKDQIEQAMLKAQKDASGGLLTDE